MERNLDKVENLMAATGCASLPPRWKELYPSVLDEYRLNGCKYATAEYYDEIHRKYDVLPDYLDIYKESARQIAQNEALSVLLLLVCTALRERENIGAEIREFALPTVDAPGVKMLPALAIASCVEYTSKLLKARGLPNDIATAALRLPEIGVREYMRRQNGEAGYLLLDWYQLSVDAKLFILGRLEFELPHKFGSNSVVFRNADGKTIILADGETFHRSGMPLGAKGCEDEKGAWRADIVETEESWTGYPYSEKGFVRSVPITLDKSEWRVALKKGDDVVAVHIPAGGGLTPEAVDKSLAACVEFLKKYYPEYKYKAFICHSWMMNPRLEEMLGDESNIAKFVKRFNHIADKTSGDAVFYFIYLKPRGTQITIDALPENTRLERETKRIYQSGDVLHEMYGVMFDDNII